MLAVLTEPFVRRPDRGSTRQPPGLAALDTFHRIVLHLDRYTMATATKVGPKYQVVIPKAVREAAGLKPGDLVEAAFGRHGIVLKPKVLVDRGLEDALAEAEADVRAGRVTGPYKSARALVRAAKRYARARERD